VDEDDLLDKAEFKANLLKSFVEIAGKDSLYGGAGDDTFWGQGESCDSTRAFKAAYHQIFISKCVYSV
jgi:Ca2+-binding RTX toxin-like protein